MNQMWREFTTLEWVGSVTLGASKLFVAKKVRGNNRPVHQWWRSRWWGCRRTHHQPGSRWRGGQSEIRRRSPGSSWLLSPGDGSGGRRRLRGRPHGQGDDAAAVTSDGRLQPANEWNGNKNVLKLWLVDLLHKWGSTLAETKCHLVPQCLWDCQNFMKF